MADADEPDNSGDSDTTESETPPEEGDTSEENQDDNNTPVIDGEDISDDNQPTEETPDVEEPAEDSVTEDDASASDEDASVDAEGDVEPASLPKPVITVKNGESELTDGQMVAFGDDVKFTIETEEKLPEGAVIWYTVNGEDPTTSSKKEVYSEGAVSLSTHTPTEEVSITIKAVAVVENADDSAATQFSEVAEFAVVKSWAMVNIDVHMGENDNFTTYDMFTVSLTTDKDVGGKWNKAILTRETSSVQVPGNAEVTVKIEPTEGYKLVNAFWGKDTEIKADNGGKIAFTKDIPGKASTSIVVYAAGKDAPVLESLKVYESGDEETGALTGKNGNYSVDGWKTYEVKAEGQHGEAFNLGSEGTELTVKLGNKDAAMAEEGKNPAYSTGGLEYKVSDGCVVLPVGKGAAGQKITVEAKAGDAKAKVTLDVSKAVTEVSLKDVKLGNAVTQQENTIRSYPLTIKDAKSADEIGVTVKELQVDGTVVSAVNAGNYFKAKVEGGSLKIVTEKFSANGNEKAPDEVKATLCFVNENEETATGASTCAGAEVTLTVKRVKNRDDADAPKYAEKLTLKKTKAASGIYTGQEAVVATVDFGKDTYNRGRDVEIYDIPEGFTIIGANDEALQADANGIVRLASAEETAGKTSQTLDDSLEIKVRIDKYAPVGKQTIKVRTTYFNDLSVTSDNAIDSVVQATGSMPVTVLRSIENIEAESVPQIYKENKKKATAKIAVAYNTENRYADAKSVAPKTKKVTYEVGYMNDNGVFEKNDDVLGTTSGSKPKPMVTVKNGTVTIDAEYGVINQTDGDAFAVRVSAADWPGNETVAVVQFKVMAETAGLEGGKVVLVDNNNIEAGFTDAAGKKTIAVNKVKTLKAIVVKKDAEPDETTNGYAATDIIDVGLYTMAPAKGNVVVNADGSITVNKLANNVVIKATANDGSKTTVQSEKFNIVYDGNVTVENAKVSAHVDYNNKKYEITKEQELKKLAGDLNNCPTGTVIHLDVTDENGKKLSGESIFDLKLAVKGAKTVRKSADNLSFDVIMNSKEMKLTLSDAKGKNPKVYSIANNILDPNGGKRLKGNTPTVSLAKGLKLYPGVENQTLRFTMNKAAIDMGADGKTRRYAKFVVISAQNSEADTAALLKQIETDKVVIRPNSKEFAVAVEGKMPELKKGASIAFTFLDKDGNVITQTTKALTIKSTALKKSYKLDAKYTLSEKDAVSVALTGKGSAVKNVKFEKLYNANVRGKINKFKTAFELDAEHGTLRLKTQTVANGSVEAVARAWEADAASKKAHKDDWIGFVEYTVTYEDGTTAGFVSKIQAALAKKDSKGVIATAKKYTASAVNVLYNENGMTGTSYVTIGKLPADVVTAYAVEKVKNVEQPESSRFKVDVLPGVDGMTRVEGNAVTLQVKADSDKNASYSGNLYFIPKDSAYAGQTQWESEQIKEKGVCVTVKVNVKKSSTKNKIKAGAKSVSFLNAESAKMELDGKIGEYYYAELPYTSSIFAEIDDSGIKLENKNVKSGETVDKTNELNLDEAKIAVRKQKNNTLGFYIDAEKFRELNEGDYWSGSVFSKVDITIPFKDGADETFKNISITMPNPNPVSEADELLAKVLKVIRQTLDANQNIGVEGIADVVYDDQSRVLTVIANDPDEEIETAMKAGTDQAIAEALLADPELKEEVKKLTSITVDVSGEGTTAGSTVNKDESNSDQANVDMLKSLLNNYQSKLVSWLKKNGKESVWGSLEGRKLDLKITATSKINGVVATKTEICKIAFIVDKEYVRDEELDGMDAAIRNATRRLSNAAAIPGVGSIDYDVEDNKITVEITDQDQNIVASKNAGRDSTVRILLGELGGEMESVDSVMFSHSENYVTNHLIVGKDGRETTEAYIADLVDKWTGMLAKTLGDDATYKKLINKELTVTTNPDSKDKVTYTIVAVLQN